jgi:hypothetical protein
MAPVLDAATTPDLIRNAESGRQHAAAKSTGPSTGPSTGQQRKIGRKKPKHLRRKDFSFLKTREIQAAPVAALAALAVCIAYLAAPPLGVDLSAQIARAGFATQHAMSPIDFRWFGGTVTFGYSLWVAPLMALIGPKTVGVIAAVLGTWATTRLFQRAGARRPLIGGLAAAFCQASSMLEGRVPFDLGLSLGLCSLLLLGRRTRSRTAGAAILGLLAGAASPVAALLMFVCAAALILHRRYSDGVLVLASSAVPVILVSGIFGEGGQQPFSIASAASAAGALAIALLLLPKKQKLLRVGAAVGILMVVVAFLLPTPVGSNATRLPLLFALPVILAFADRGRRIIAMAVVMTFAVQAPASASTVMQAGTPESKATFYTPVIRELMWRGPLSGRVEVPESAGHWESAYVAKYLPLARGWLRQVDVKLNDQVFYKDRPTAETYRQFLRSNAVQYVAIPNASLTKNGDKERTLVQAGLPYLHRVWSNANWQLYAVDDPVPVVNLPGRIQDYTEATVVLRAPANATVHLGLRWFTWLSLQSSEPIACIANVDGDVILHTGPKGGTYTIGSSLPAGSNHCD